jgi:hypothetical protein
MVASLEAPAEDLLYRLAQNFEELSSGMVAIGAFGAN